MVWSLYGASDIAGVMEKLLEYYKNFVHESDIATEFSIPAEHAMVGLPSCSVLSSILEVVDDCFNCS